MQIWHRCASKWLRRAECFDGNCCDHAVTAGSLVGSKQTPRPIDNEQLTALSDLQETHNLQCESKDMQDRNSFWVGKAAVGSCLCAMCSRQLEERAARGTFAFCIIRSCGSTDTASRYTHSAHITCTMTMQPCYNRSVHSCCMYRLHQPSSNTSLQQRQPAACMQIAVVSALTKKAPPGPRQPMYYQRRVRSQRRI